MGTQAGTIQGDALLDRAIRELYATTGAPRPSLCCPTVRLAELIGALNLTCSELGGLTQASAAQELARRGALLEEEGRSGEPLAGFLYAVSGYGSIFVEQDDLVTRRRFSAAHELGHYLLHFRPLLEQTEEEAGPLEVCEALPRGNDESEPDDMPHGQILLPLPELHMRQLLPLAQMEREANRFAAELLMPSALVRELAGRARRHFSDEDLIWRLATDLLVSRAAMRWKLRSLGLLPHEAAHWN
jgi:hypothetical protein